MKKALISQSLLLLLLSSLLSLLLISAPALAALSEEAAAAAEEIPASGPSNSLHLFLDAQGGQWKEDVSGDKGETGKSSLSIEYEHFFKPLETTDAPYAMRKFLEHPSTLSASHVSFASETGWDGSVKETKAGGATLSLGGMYFGETTGFGAEVSFGAQEMKNDALGVKEESESGGLALRLEHYAAPATRLHLALSGSRENTDDLNSALNNEETKDGMISIGVSSLINKKIWLSGELGSGWRKYTKDSDPALKYRTGMLSLEFGYFFSQQFGLMVALEGMSYEHKDIKHEGGTGRFSVGVEYYPSASGYFGVALVSTSTTEETAAEDTEESTSGLRLQGGFLF